MGRYSESHTEKQWFKSWASSADAEDVVHSVIPSFSFFNSFRMLMWSTALVFSQLLHDAVMFVRYWSAILGQVILVVGHITQCMLSAGSVNHGHDSQSHPVGVVVCQLHFSVLRFTHYGGYYNYLCI